MIPHERPLSSRRFRSVVLESGSDPCAVVVKRFHHPNPLLARFDRARARREYSALQALARAGLPVPRPLGVRSTNRGWEVRLTAIAGARTLEEFLRPGCEPPPGGWPRLVASLGRVLARLQEAGWEHGDLHPGNVLVDSGGGPWLVDLQRARRVEADPARRLASLVDCAALAREILPGRLRARFVVAWRAALPVGMRPAREGRTFAHLVEERARVRRVELVRIGLNRWLRESSRVRPITVATGSGWLRRDLAEPPDLELDRPGLARWIVMRGEREELQERWLGAARLVEHGLPAARPALLVHGSRWVGNKASHAVFEVPLLTAPSRKALGEALADRGLGLVRALHASAGNGLFLLPPREPEDFRA